MICRIGNSKWYHEGVSPGGKPIYDEFIQLFNSHQVNKLISFMSEPEIRNEFGASYCISQTQELLRLINLDLQEPRTQEAIEFIINNLPSYKTKIFNTKELQACLKFL